jgi:DNA-binding SARP family transcriptional activator
MGGKLDIKILGSLAVYCANTLVTPTARKPRTVLAMLAVHANEPVPIDAVIVELWRDRVPSSAKTTVQTYVMKLRKMIDDALCSQHDGSRREAKHELVTVPGGYVLHALPESVDLWQFDRLAASAHKAREAGDFTTAARQFGEALSCWRGRALFDVAVGPHLQAAITRLEEARLNVLDCRIDADLRLGRHHALLGELAALVERYPSHEGLAGHLMLALYRSGRRCDALNAYRRLQTCLADTHGLEPSPPLRRLQHAMLVSDHGSTEATESWHAVTTNGRPRGSRTGRPTTATGRISADIASISWQANSMAELGVDQRLPG